VPRLLTRISTRGVAFSRLAAPSVVAGSARTPSPRAPPARRMLSTASSSFAWVRPAMTTFAPSTASLRAIARPIPPVDPVTSAVLSLSCRSMAETPFLEHSVLDGGDTHLLQESEVVLDAPIVGDATIPDLQQIGGNEGNRL